ncbi:MAG: GAF domain-containing protein [Candidatus Polarisedimenticolia bacterium]
MKRNPEEPRPPAEPEHVARGEELRNMFNRARAFTEDLLRENERLRFRIAGLQRELETAGGGATPAGEVASLVERLRAAERERDDLLGRFREVEQANREVASRYQEIETQNNQLANLYVASYQLHATLDFAEVLDTVREILINLVGAEAFAIFWVDEKFGTLRREAAQGMGESVPETLRPEDGPLRRAAQAGESFYADPLPDPARVDAAHPIACVPLRIGVRPIGLVAIYRLLSQKERFSPLDFELFTLLGGHAATALFSSKLYQKSEQKLSSLQGFLDLLTAPSP